MITVTKIALISVVCAALAGCKSNASNQPTKAPQPPQTNSSHPNATAQKLDNCDAIADPVQAEDCRFDKKVAADKKKHNSNNAVKHSPGSIQQP